MNLTSPEAGQRASRLVDWLEVLAISQSGRWLGCSEIDKLIRLHESGRDARRTFDIETGENLEQEILQENSREILRSVVSEQKRRIDTLGELYPFETRDSLSWAGSSPQIKLEADQDLSAANISYLCCLLISSLRHGILAREDADNEVLEDENLVHSEYRYGQVLQVCATIALGGYLGGPVYSFGYPRPDGTNFLDAHNKVWRDFGAYAPVENVPIGLPDQENDAGIDLIGWLEFGDRMGAKILVIGQVASGRNWSGKSVVDRAKSLKSWFGGGAYEWFTPAMIMPFNITDARATVRESSDALEFRRKTLEHEERQYGIMLDRDRITRSTSFAFQLDDAAQSQIQGIDEFQIVEAWVVKVISQIRA